MEDLKAFYEIGKHSSVLKNFMNVNKPNCVQTGSCLLSNVSLLLLVL